MALSDDAALVSRALELGVRLTGFSPRRPRTASEVAQQKRERSHLRAEVFERLLDPLHRKNEEDRREQHPTGMSMAVARAFELRCVLCERRRGGWTCVCVERERGRDRERQRSGESENTREDRVKETAVRERERISVSEKWERTATV